MEKAALRKAMIERRTGLTPGERHRLSDDAQRTVLASDAYKRAGTVLLYIPFRGEVETGLIAQAGATAGKRLVLPRVQKEPRRLWLHAYSGEPATLISGAYGIPEPDPAWPPVDFGAVDLVVVPGVAFDTAGNRLGYGGGYYDRTLPAIRAANPAAVLLGLAYGFQVVQALPSDPHDIPVDAVATEAGLLSIQQGG